MAFDIQISPRAFLDIDELATELKERSQSYDVARKWFLSVVYAIDSLAEMPERHPVVTDAQDELERVRVLLYGKRSRRYRIYYCARKLSPSSGTVSVSMCGIHSIFFSSSSPAGRVERSCPNDNRNTK